MISMDTQPIEMRTVDLTYDNAVDPLLAIPPSQRSYGGEPVVEKGHVRLRIGERPIVRNLNLLYRKSGRALPADLEVFSAYNIWLIVFSVGVVREAGLREVERFGFVATFPEKPRVTILNVLPQTRFVTRAGARLRAEATLALNGGAKVPEALTQAISATEVLSGDAQLRLTTEANVVGTLSFSLITPVVESVGVGGRRAEWVFEKAEEPLVGDQQMVVTLLTPKTVDELEVTVRLSATVAVFNLLPCNLETDMALAIPLS